MTMIKKAVQALINVLDQARADIQTEIDERTEYFDERSEKWQESEKGEEYTENTDKWQEAFDNLDNAIGMLEELS